MRIRHRKHINNAFLDLERRFDDCLSFADDPELQEKELRLTLIQLQHDISATAPVAERLQLIERDRDALAYLASLPRNWNAVDKRLLRPSRADLIHLFERRLACIDVWERKMPGHAAQPFVKAEANAWRDYIARLETDWYDTLPEVLEVDR